MRLSPYRHPFLLAQSTRLLSPSSATPFPPPDLPALHRDARLHPRQAMGGKLPRGNVLIGPRESCATWHGAEPPTLPRWDSRLGDEGMSQYKYNIEMQRLERWEPKLASPRFPTSTSLSQALLFGRSRPLYRPRHSLLDPAAVNGHLLSSAARAINAARGTCGQRMIFFFCGNPVVGAGLLDPVVLRRNAVPLVADQSPSTEIRD